MNPSQRHLPGLPGNPHSAHLQGLRSHLGAEAEKLIDELHAVCARAGLAWVSRVSSHMKILRHLGRGRTKGALTGAPVVDAMGWTRDGRAIALEIKHIRRLGLAEKIGGAAVDREGETAGRLALAPRSAVEVVPPDEVSGAGDR